MVAIATMLTVAAALPIPEAGVRLRARYLAISHFVKDYSLPLRCVRVKRPLTASIALSRP